MLRYWIYLFVASAIFSNSAFARLPNHSRTPGATNPDVTQDNIHQTICVSGWTATIRPPSSYTSSLKTQQIKEYRYQEKRPAEYEEDHLISLFTWLTRSWPISLRRAPVKRPKSGIQ
jgi:hypothetical protein